MTPDKQVNNDLLPILSVTKAKMGVNKAVYRVIRDKILLPVVSETPKLFCKIPLRLF